jgi:hypothetical protein
MRRAPLELDFVAPRRRGRTLGFAILAAALVVAFALVEKYAETGRRLRQLEAAEALLDGARPAPALPRERLEREMQSAQATVRQLGLPWAQLIDALERAATKEVALLNIQPDAQNRRVRLTAEARQQEMMLEYLRRLAATGGFGEVHLLSHQVREDDPRRPLQFSVQASYREMQ